MFDVKPTKESAVFDLYRIKREVDLKPKKTAAIPIAEKKVDPAEIIPVITSSPQPSPEPVSKNEIVQKTENPKEAILKEFEHAISGPADITAELASVGGQLYNSNGQVAKFRRGLIKPARKPSRQPVPEIVVQRKNPEERKPVSLPKLPEPKRIEPASPVSREIDVWLANIKNNRHALSSSVPSKKRRGSIKTKLRWPHFKNPRRAILYLAGFVLVGLLIFGFTRRNTIGVQNNVLHNGDNAVANLEDAKQKLENLNFLGAADSFALAYDDFNKASGTLNQLGVSFLSLFGNLPGLNKLKAANDLVEAGQSLSRAGENLSLAFGTLYQTNLFSFLKPSLAGQTGYDQKNSLSKLITDLKAVLVFADNNIKKATGLLADIDSAVIPEDKQQLFLDFKDKIPDFQKYIGEAINYSDFLLKFVGDSGAKTYLVLLQNNDELRATGGFPGTYALITFDKGYLKKIFIDDVYQIDGGIRENIIPPIPLQHITANWGMRDANWFADFPTSAKKIEEFYKLDNSEGDGQIDGVLTITPDIIAKMLGVIGPIDMPEYGMKLDQNNFLDQIQNEVEYKADKSKPKKIITDLEPKFFDKLSQQDKDHWLEIFKIILEAVQQKHILAYFNNPELEGVAVKNNFGGEIKQSPADYMQVVFTNVKGSKTDAVTDNSLSLKIAADNTAKAVHTLTIDRTHNGGGLKYGFYNRDNSAYIRVYVPKGSVLENIKGQSATDFQPLVDYGSLDFKKDSDLNLLEEGTTHPFSGVDVYQESDRTVFGFWLITKPHEKKIVSLSYYTPDSAADASNYKLFWQKQSGTGADPINFSFKLPYDTRVLKQSDGLQTIGDTLVLTSDLSIDREIDIDFK